MTTINISSVSDPLLSIPSGVTVPAWAGVRISGSLALTADADWTKLGTVMLGTGTAINLAGCGLTLSAFAVESGSAAFNNSGDSTATLTLTGTAGTSFNGVSIGDKVKVVKSGVGDMVKDSQLQIGGATGAEFDIANGAFYLSGIADLVAGFYNNKGTIKVSGGKVNMYDLWVAFTTGAVGVFEQSGGEIAISRDMTLGCHAGVGTVRQTGGKMTVGGTLYLCKNNNNVQKTGTLTQSAGEIEVAGKAIIGYANQSEGTVGVGGKMTVSGGVEFGNYGGTGTLCVTNGGRLVTSGFVRGSGTANILFDGGTVQATAANANFFSRIGAITVGANGFVFDVASYTISLPATVSIATGATIAVKGTGALDVSGTTCDLTAAPTESFDLLTTEGAAFSTLPTVTVGGEALSRGWRVVKSADGKKITIKRRKGAMIIAY